MNKCFRPGRRHQRVAMLGRHIDKIAKHIVELDLQSRNAGLFGIPGLHLGDDPAAVISQPTHFIQRSVPAGATKPPSRARVGGLSLIARAISPARAARSGWPDRSSCSQARSSLSGSAPACFNRPDASLAACKAFEMASRSRGPPRRRLSRVRARSRSGACRKRARRSSRADVSSTNHAAASRRASISATPATGGQAARPACGRRGLSPSGRQCQAMILRARIHRPVNLKARPRSRINGEVSCRVRPARRV